MIYTDQTCVKKKKKLNIRGWVAIMIIIATLCCLFIGHKTRHYYSVEVSDFNGLTASATKLQTGKTSTIMSANRTYLQELMDTVSNNGGGEIYLPAGTFYFNSAGKAANGTANYEYCLVPRDNVKIIGKGESTILKPYGTVQEGLDLFYYNSVTENIRDGSRYKYLTNADFSSFVIDGDEAHCTVYNSSGKGFMINIFKNCDWDNVIVKNTIATGFGMDCPIDCSIMNCKAIGCGREADKAIGGGGENAKGASGFGIGTGYVDDESIYIDGCVANNNYKYGFFFEHQGYYLKNTYTATGTSNRFVVNDCLAEGNMFDFGGFRAYDCVFQNCTSTSTNSDGNNKCPLSFGENTVRSYFVNMNVMRTFTDVPMSNQYYTAIDWALKNGVVNGTTSNSFSPNTSIKRGDAIEIIYRSCNLDGVLFRGRDNADYESNLYSFSDVPRTSYYANAIKWALDKKHIVEGNPSGTFEPERACTKAEYATMIYRLAGSPSLSSQTLPYTDVTSSDWYYNAVCWCYSKGIITDTGTTYGASNSITRAVAINMLYKYWTLPSTYNLIYNLTYGKYTSLNQTYNTNSTFTVGSITRSGYRFLGWNGANGPEPSLSPRGSGVTGPVVLTALWKKIDTTPPTVTNTIPTAADATSPKQGIATVYDADSGISRVYLTKDSETNIIQDNMVPNDQGQYIYYVTENGTYYIYAVDNDGNTGGSGFTVNGLSGGGGDDPDPGTVGTPNIDYVANPSTGTTKTITLSISVIPNDSRGLQSFKCTDPDGNVTNFTLNSTNTYSYTIRKNGRYSFEAKNKGGYTFTKNLTVTRIDNEGPVAPTYDSLTNSGSYYTVNIHVSDSQSQVGSIEYSYNNSSFKDITSSGSDVSISLGTLPRNGNLYLNINKTGQSKIYFRCIDTLGNVGPSSELVLETTPGDTTGPTITLNSFDTSYTNASSRTLKVNVTDSSGVKKVYVTPPGGTQTEVTTHSGNVYSYNVSDNGTYRFRATDTYDNEGNYSYTVSCFDRVAPTNNAPTITSSTYNSVTIRCEQTDTASGLDSPYSFYASKSNSLPSNPSWITNTNKTYTFGSLESNTNYYFWTKVKDKAGNETVSSRAFVKTSTEPSNPIPSGSDAITLSVDNPNWTNSNKTVTAVSSADSKYTVQMSSDGTNYSNRTTLTVTQNSTVYARLAYNGEYGTPTYIDVTKIDKVAPTNDTPTITASTYNSVTIRCEQTDAASGLDSPYSFFASKSNSLPSNPSWVTNSNKTYTFGSLESNTNYYFWTKVKDKAGNETVSSRAFIKTSAEPSNPIPSGSDAITLSVNNPNWTNSDKTVTAVSSADSKYTVQMSSDGTNYSNRTTLTVAQNTRVYARLAYNGEYGTPTYIDVTKIDKVKPSTDKPTVNNITTNKATVKANQTDNSGGSGIKEYYFYMQEGNSLPSNPSWVKGTGTTLEFTGLTESKTYYVWTRVIDNAGNEQVSASNNFKTSTPTPDPIPSGSSIELTVDNPDWTNRNKVVTAVSHEDPKYVIQMSLDGTAFNDGTQISVPENGKVYARYSYNGAFGSSKNITVTKIDKQKPSTDMPTVTQMESKKATLKCNQKDESGGSGINKQYFFISTSDTLPSNVEWMESVDTISLEGLINHSTYYIWTKATDNAGNEQVSERNEFLLDKSEPIPKASEALSLSVNNPNWTNQNKIVTATKVKENIYEIQMSTDGTNYTNVTQIEVSSNTQVYARLTDGYEYSEPTSIMVSKIDKVPPTNTAPVPSKVTTRYIYTGIKQVDNESGIETKLYRLTDVDGNIGSWQSNPVFDRLKQGETYYIQTYAKDRAGNESYSEVTEVTMLTIPSGEAAITLTPDVPLDVTTFLNVTVIASTDSDFDIQTSTNGKKYVDIDRQTLENNGVVYARLTDGYNYGEPVSIIINNIQHLYPTPDETLFDLDDPPTLSTTVGDRWTNGDVTVISSQLENYFVQTKLNDGEWEDTDRQVATQYGDKVYARYTDGYFYSPEVLLIVNNIDKEPPTNTAPSVQIVENNQDCIDIILNQIDELSGINEEFTKYRVIDEHNNSTPWQDSLRFDNLELYKRYFAQTYVVDRAGNESYSEYTPFKIALYDDDGNLIDNDGNFVDEDGNIIKPIGQIDIVNDVVNTTLTEEITNTTTNTTTNTVVNNVVDNQDDVIEEHNEPVGQVQNDEPTDTGTTENNPQVDVPKEEQNNNSLGSSKGQDKTILVPKNTDTSKVIDVPVGTSESSIPKSGSPRKVGIIGLIILLVGISLYFYKKNDEYKY